MNDVDKKKRRDIEKMKEEIALSHESIDKQLREIEESAMVTKRLSYDLMRGWLDFLKGSESLKNVKEEEYIMLRKGWIARVRELAQISSFWKLCAEGDIAKALYEYAGMLERLMECRDHMIPHRHDAEIIDYILTGKKEHL